MQTGRKDGVAVQAGGFAHGQPPPPNGGIPLAHPVPRLIHGNDHTIIGNYGTIISVRESEVAEIVISGLEEGGWLWHWCSDSRRCRGPKGLPDLIGVHRARGMLAIECKGDLSNGRGRKPKRGKPSEDQLKWMRALAVANVHVELATPDNATAVAAWCAGRLNG